MKVLRYTEEIQKAVGSKIKAEPWMHIVLSDDKYAVYVWDTRKILEAGKSKTEYAKIEGTAAKDSHKPLQGEHANAFQFNRNAQQADNPDLNIAIVRGFTWYGRGDSGETTNVHIVHNIKQAKKLLENAKYSRIFNLADLKPEDTTKYHDDNATTKFLNSTGTKLYSVSITDRASIDKFKKAIDEGDISVFKTGGRQFVNFGFYATTDMQGSKLYAISDKSKLKEFAKL